MLGFAEGEYVQVASYPYGNSRGILMTSRDGQSWEKRLFTTATPMTSIAFGNSSAVVTVDRGGIMQSAPFEKTAPDLVVPPASVVVTPGNPAVLSVTAIGTEPMTYRWFQDKEPVANPDGHFLVITNLAPGRVYEYRVEVCNLLGTTMSDSVRVVAGEPVRLTMHAGTNNQLTIQGTAGLSCQVDYLESLRTPYQWQSLTNISLSQPVVTVTDPLPATSSRFYRARLMP